MTNKERLISLLGFGVSDQNSLEGAMIDRGIVGTDPYASGNTVTLKKCAIEVMELLLTTADTTDSTPGFSTTFDRDAVLKRINLLKGEIGLVDESMPTIENASFMW